MSRIPMQAPELQIAQWFNTDSPLSLSDLRGRIVVLHAFQMLCPGCVSHGLPQATAMYNLFSKRDVAVIGIHTVFEHHDAMNPQALKAFLHEYRIPFPVGVDQPDSSNPIPLTMQAYQLRGTPSLVLIDRTGAIRLNHFGRLDDLRAGAVIGELIAETHTEIRPSAANDDHADQTTNSCDDDHCALS